MFTVSDMTVVLYIKSLKMNLYINQIISSIISNTKLVFKPIFVSTPLKFNSFLVMLVRRRIVIHCNVFVFAVIELSRYEIKLSGEHI